MRLVPLLAVQISGDFYNYDDDYDSVPLSVSCRRSQSVNAYELTPQRKRRTRSIAHSWS